MAGLAVSVALHSRDPEARLGQASDMSMPPIEWTPVLDRVRAARKIRRCIESGHGSHYHFIFVMHAHSIPNVYIM